MSRSTSAGSPSSSPPCAISAMRSARRGGACSTARSTTPAIAAISPRSSRAGCEDEHPAGLTVLAPGDFRVRQSLEAAAERLGLPLDIRNDRHFLCAPVQFGEFMARNPRPVLETFYRTMRRRHGILLDGGKPVGGAWNYDRENRAPLGRNAPPIPPPPRFAPDAVTRDVLAMVAREFPDSPGRLDDFALPVVARGFAAPRSTISSPIACRISAATRMRCAMASPSCSTRCSRGRSTCTC